MISNNENEQLCYCPTKIDYSSDKFAHLQKFLALITQKYTQGLY